MKPKTELMAFRIPEDLAVTIRKQAVNGATITDVVVRMLRSAPVRFNYTEFHDGLQTSSLQEAVEHTMEQARRDFNRPPHVNPYPPRPSTAWRRGPRQKGDKGR